MKYLIALLLAIAAITTVPAHAHPVAIVNHENQAIKRFDNKVLTAEEVQKGIREAAAKLGWRVEPGEPGHIIATLQVRQHTAVVDIAYSQTSYSIVYKDSTNLDYGVQTTSGIEQGKIVTSKRSVIHANYNKWVQQLNDAIFRRLQE